MKHNSKTKLFLILFFCSVFKSLNAQYTVQLSKENYSELSGATRLTYYQSDNGYYFNTVFKFGVFNRVADFGQNMNPPSAGVYVAHGYAAVYEVPGYQNTVVFQAFYNQAFRVAPDTTTVWAKYEGTSPNRIIKIEHRDFVFDENEKVNFQIWLHEADSSISYHYGPNTLKSRAIQGYSGIVVINPDFTQSLDQFHIEGSPSKPKVYTGIKDLAWPTLDSFPVEGSVISFKRSKATSIKENTIENIVNVYPNPAKNAITVAHNFNSANLYIVDVLGHVVLNETISGGRQPINIGHLSAGIYTIFIKDDKNCKQIKFVKD